MIYYTNTPEETEQLAAQFAEKLKKNDFVALYGDLGTGKTAFTRGLCSKLCPEEYVSSPTYALVNEYTGDDVRVCHFDMYRITSEDALYSIGFYDYNDCIIVCEWCENIEYALPEEYYKVTITKESDGRRKIEIKNPTD